MYHRAPNINITVDGNENDRTEETIESIRQATLPYSNRQDLDFMPDVITYDMDAERVRVKYGPPKF
jgi:hypothetical protein